MSTDVRLQHVSLSCNGNPHCLDWSGEGFLAFGADKSIAVMQFDSNEITATLHGHTDRVNCVKWITTRSRCTVPNFHHGKAERGTMELLSGAVDSTVIVWQGEGTNLVPKQRLKSHLGPVTSLAATYLPTASLSTDGKVGDTTTGTLVASASSDSTVVLWERRSMDGEFEVLQVISFGKGFAMGLDFFVLPGVEVPIFACGADNARVHLFMRKTCKFVSELSLDGHEDWVRDLRFAQEDSGDLLLASCSQDTHIRLWRIQNAVTGNEEGSDVEHLSLSANTFCVQVGQVEKSFAVTLESVLIGHEDSVYSIHWQPLTLTSDASSVVPAFTQPLCLLSSSMDKTMVVWSPDSSTGLWVEQVRVGDVGGNTLGLYGAMFSPQGDFILAHGYQGALHLWKRFVPLVSPEGSSDRTNQVWQPVPMPSGHFGPVQDISWEPNEGNYLLSVSSDQTARLLSPWVRKEGLDGKELAKVSWYEIARPQIHGYNLQCVAMVTPLQYISGADEKVLRVFEAPTNFIGNLSRISETHFGEVTEKVPLGASVPSLGLSNKAIYTDRALDTGDSDEVVKNPFSEHVTSFTPVDLAEPPVESHLLQNTLWPETQKLYGHGFEIFCLCSSSDGKYVASACKATKPEQASVRVWDTSTWQQIALLAHHTLTVTQLAFSHAGLYLLAVSRDRCWSLWKCSEESRFVLVAKSDKTTQTHSRVIWSCSWTCDDRCFATASRDKKVLLWSQGSTLEGAKDCGEGWKVASPALQLAHAVTAIDFAPGCLRPEQYLLAIGLESGEISLYFCAINAPSWTPVVVFDPRICHTSTVKRLQWRPMKTHGIAPHTLCLASCSQDCSVRIFNV